MALILCLYERWRSVNQQSVLEDFAELLHLAWRTALGRQIGETGHMPRGMTPGKYVSDGGTEYRWNTDRDRFADGTFGWTAATIAQNRLPRGCTPRHVTGVSATTGFRGTAVVPVVTADVWTGVATTFDIEATDGTTDTMTITNRIGERPALA